MAAQCEGAAGPIRHAQRHNRESRIMWQAGSPEQRDSVKLTVYVSQSQPVEFAISDNIAECMYKLINL